MHPSLSLIHPWRIHNALHPVCRVLCLAGWLGVSSVPGADRTPYGLAEGRWTERAGADATRQMEALGERSGMWGSLADGLEAWVYPYKLFQGFELAVAQEGQAEFRNWREVALEQVAAPHYAQAQMQGEGWNGTVTLWAPRDLPGVICRMEFRSQRNLRVALRWRPVLAPMHLEGPASLDPTWMESSGALSFKDEGRGWQGMVQLQGASVQRNRNGAWEEWVVSVPGAIPGGKRSDFAVLAVADGPDGPSVADTLRLMWRDERRLFEEKAAHVVALLRAGPQVHAPDRRVGRAMAWGKISLDQLRVRNPYLGHGLVSGYSGSGEGTRPRYAWFFEEPTLSSWALHRVGLSGHVRESLEFLQRWQRADGKTVHEVTQSLPFWPDYFSQFPYAYMHTDGAVYFLAAYGHYHRQTGDAELIRREWPKIRRTFEWCWEQRDEKDGLLSIAPGDWGSAESSTMVWRDTQLEAMWVRALDEMSDLARLMGETNLAQRCAVEAERALASLEDMFWSEEKGRYIWGVRRDGTRLTEHVPHHAVGFWLSRLQENRVRRSLERMAAADMRTDWGVRSLARSEGAHAADSYQGGSVWPVWNAGVLVSDFRQGRAMDGFRNWWSMVQLRTLHHLGPMPEVLDGVRCRLLPEAVPHQMFSELAVINGFFDGLLGLEVDVPARRWVVTPRLPPHWPFLDVFQIPFGTGTLDVRLRQDRTSWRGDFLFLDPRESSGVIRPELPPGTRVESVRVDGQPWPYRVLEGASGMVVEILLPSMKERRRVVINHRGGVGWLPVDEPLIRGETSRNLRVIQARWDQDALEWQLEGRPGQTYRLRLFTDRLVREVEGGRMAEVEGAVAEVDLPWPTDLAPDQDGYAPGRVRVSFW